MHGSGKSGSEIRKLARSEHPRKCRTWIPSAFPKKARIEISLLSCLRQDQGSLYPKRRPSFRAQPALPSAADPFWLHLWPSQWPLVNTPSRLPPLTTNLSNVLSLALHKLHYWTAFYTDYSCPASGCSIFTRLYA
eukprot:scpid35933/ scgid14768/ 